MTLTSGASRLANLVGQVEEGVASARRAKIGLARAGEAVAVAGDALQIDLDRNACRALLLALDALELVERPVGHARGTLSGLLDAASAGALAVVALIVLREVAERTEWALGEALVAAQILKSA